MSDRWWDYGGVQWDNGEGSHELEQLGVGNAAWNACAANQGAQVERLACKVCGSTVHGHIGTLCANAAVDGAEVLRSQVGKLEAENAKLKSLVGSDVEAIDFQRHAAVTFRGRLEAEQSRANALADECGRLRDENTQLLAENARLRRAKR